MTTDPGCIFCKIIDGVIPSDIVLRDEHVVAFRDVNPVAPTHILLVPTMHVAHLSAFAARADPSASARLLAAAAAFPRVGGTPDDLAAGMNDGFSVRARAGGLDFDSRTIFCLARLNRTAVCVVEPGALALNPSPWR